MVNEYLRHGKLVVPSHLDLKLLMTVAQELGLTDLAQLIKKNQNQKEEPDWIKPLQETLEEILRKTNILIFADNRPKFSVKLF